MTVERCDLAIVGAGPAGMSAAVEADRHGLSVVVLDDQPAAGGQILRGITAPPGPVSYEGWGHALLRDFRASRARHIAGATVWAREGRQIVYSKDGAPHRLEARGLILATGSQERPVPVPGNTLPGVVTVGALQSLLKGSKCVPAGRFVLAGCGPLLLLCALQLAKAGARPLAIIDTMPASRRFEALADLPRLMFDPPLMAQAVGLLGRTHWLDVPYHAQAGNLRISGIDRAEAISFDAGGRPHSLDVDIVALHDGVVPNDALAVAMGARTRWNGSLACHELEMGTATQPAGLKDTWAAGDGVAIAGGYLATLSGRLAALDAALALSGTLPAQRHARQADMLRARRARLLKARRFVDRYYAPTLLPAGAADDAFLCRCEEVTFGMVRGKIAEGVTGTRAMKAATRCGMGPCQGRQCTASLVGLLLHENPDMTIERPSGRFPARPVTVAELAASDHGRRYTGSDV